MRHDDIEAMLVQIETRLAELAPPPPDPSRIYAELITDRRDSYYPRIEPVELERRSGTQTLVFHSVERCIILGVRIIDELGLRLWQMNFKTASKANPGDKIQLELNLETTTGI